MANLTGSTIASTYLPLLRITNNTMGVAGTAYYIKDSVDTNSALSISTTRVGIGTATPATMLHVSGSASPAIRVTDTTSPINVDMGANDTLGFVGTVTSHGFSIKTADTARISVLASGYVGIAAATPYCYLQMSSVTCMHGDANSAYFGANFKGTGTHRIGENYAQQLHFNASDGSTSLYYAGDSAAGSEISWSTALKVLNDGKIGIGTATPGELLTINGTAATAINITDSGATSHGMTNFITDGYTCGRLAQIHTSNLGFLVMGASSHADQIGLVLAGYIGVADPTDSIPAIKLEAGKKDGADGAALGAAETVLQVYNYTSAVLTALGNGYVGILDVTPTKALDVKNGASGGDILCYDIYTHDSGVETSDERMKENIIDSALGLNFVNALKPRSFKWKDTEEYTDDDDQIFEAVTYERTHYGMISQEVKQTMSDLGLSDKDFAGWGYEEDRDIYFLRYTEFISPLIKAIQELSAKVEALENA